jgi:hypothetical protein
LVKNQYQKGTKTLSGHGAKATPPGKLFAGMKKIFRPQNILIKHFLKKNLPMLPTGPVYGLCKNMEVFISIQILK